MKISVKMVPEKTTKNTFLYKAKPGQGPVAVRNIYVDKLAFVDPPKEIVVTVEEVTDGN